MNFSRLDAFLNFVVKLPWSCFIRNQYAGGRFYGKENESAFSGSFCRPRIVLGGGALISPQTTFAAEVTISDPSDARLNQAELAGGASTGPGDNTPIVGNLLTFKNVSFMGTGYYTGIGYGGRNFAGTVVERNRIHVDGAQVKIAIGGSGLNGAVRDNTALVYNLSKVQTAKGGEANGTGQENTASGNHLGVISSVVQSGYGGLSTYGTAEKNTVEISGGAFMQNVYGGSGGFSSPLATIRENSVTIENATFQDLGAQFPGSIDHTKEIAGGVVQSIVGGIGSTISENSVTIKSGTIGVPVYGGKSYNGATVTKNKVVLTGGTYTDLIYGGDAHTEASENEVHLTNVTVPAVFGGSAAIANNNKIYLNGGVTVAQAIVGGDGTTSTGNTLTVKGVNTVQDRIKEVQKYAFDIAGVASTANPLLTVGGAVQTDMDWTQLSVTGTPAASLLNQTITLMRQSGSDIAFGLTYNGKKVATDDGVEHIVDTDTQASTAHEITSTSYAFKGQTTPSQIGTDTWGGRSVGGNSTRENTIELSSGTHTDVYGGWTTGTGTTAEDKDASYKNIVTVKSGATVTGDVYGGSAANGAAHDNTVHIDGTTIGGAVIGGRGSTATNNTVQLTNAAVGGTVTGGMVGTAAGGTDNTLRVKGNSTAAQMNGFQKFHFDLAGASTATPMLGITGTARTWLDWAQLTTDGSGAGVTLLSNPHGLDVANYTGAITTTTDTTERNIDTDTHSDTNVTSIRAESYQFAGVTAPVTLTGDANGYGGISRAGNSTRNNAVELSLGNYADFYGGHTSGAGTTQTDKNDSHDNTVTVKSGVTVTNVYGGFAANGAATKNTVHIDGGSPLGDVIGGRGNTATNNTVTVTNGSAAAVIGGQSTGDATGNVVTLGGNFTGNLTGAVSTTGAASHNTLDLGTFDLAGNVTGGSGTAAADNVIALRGTHVTGTVTGGRVGGTAGGVNNTLAVYYNAARSSEIGDFAGVQNLHFYLGDAAANTASTLLKLMNAGGDKDVSGLKIRVGRSGAAAKLQKGDTFTLMENAAGNITGDAARVTGEGMDGVSRLYRFAVAPDEANRNKLIATVTSVGFAEQAKSFVETRAGAAAFLGSGGDFLVETALPSAQKEAAGQGAADGGSYALWAGMGGNAMKYKTGSHVDMKGWSLGVGWARPLAVAEGTLTFGPFVEYGRGSYDSYLDDGTHADGTASYLGLGVMAKLKTTDGTWAEASMRLGRTKSDYAGVLDGTAASYDSASSYYAGHLGIGKELRLREKDTLNVYLRYFHAHTGAADETISTGERYHFDAVNSHRTRLGLRWTQELKDAAQLYAGLAWEYEFGGDARASYDGEGTPTPTLKGSSALLELGYRFAPKASRVNYDLHLTGWQGKRQGVTGGASVNWMF